MRRIVSLFDKLNQHPSDISEAEDEMGALHMMLLQDSSATLRDSVLDTMSSMGEHYVCLLRFIGRYALCSGCVAFREL